MRTNHRRGISLCSAAATTAATALLAAVSARPAQASLQINWLGDDYTGGPSWISNSTSGSLSISATPTGTFIAPTAVPSAFGTHTGVDFSTAGSALEIPSGTFPTNANPANFTVAAVFKANGPAVTSGGSFFNGQNIFGNDSPGGGTPDWCFTWGGVANQSVFGSIGFTGGDSAFQSGSIDINAVHAVVMVVDATNSTQSVFFDGKLMGRRTGITIQPRTDPAIYRIGGGYFNGSFNGRIAELRVYDDASQDGLLLSQQLANFYGAAYPIQTLYTWANAASGSFENAANWNPASVPNDIGYHQALVNNGGTVLIGGSNTFNVSDLWVGSFTGGSGHVVQTGGTMNVGATLVLGQNGGSGDYDLSGGTLNATNVTVAGGGTLANVATMTVRNTAVLNVTGGTLNVAGNGGTLNTGTMIVRDNAAVNLTGTVNQPIRLGNTGTATFILQDSAQVNTGVSELWVGNGSTFSNATMNQTGGTLNVNNWLAVGRDRSTGTLNLSGGVINKTGNGNITIGAVNNSTFTSNGIINQTGGQIIGLRNPNDAAAPGIVGGEIFIGETTQGKGTWNMSAGSASAPVISIGYQGQGTLNMSGTAQMTADAFGVARAGTFGAVANLNGGTIATAQFFRGGSTGPAVVNFNGTKIVATSDNDRFVAGFGTSDLVLGAGGALIDTNGHNIGIDSGFSGTGSLVKNGAGVMTLNGGANNTHSGPTVINTGTLRLQRVVADNSILARDISAFYRFNDGSNVGKDSSANANDIFDVGGTAVITSSSAPPNHTASMSLPNNFVNADFLSTVDGNTPPNFPSGNNSYTIAAWINVDGTNTNQTNGIVGWGDLGATAGRQRTSITFRTQNNAATPNGLRNSWFIVDAAGNLPAGQSFVNQWHHVVATYDANTDYRRIYYDGTLLVSDNTPGLNNAGTQNFRVGAATLGEWFSGNMADLLIARSALTLAQVQQLMNNGLTFGSFAGSTGALSPNSVVQIASGATLDLNGASSPSGGLGNVGASGGIVTSSSAGSAVLTLGPTGSTSFSGVIQNGSGTVGITKTGAGTQILSGSNTYTGTTTTQAGYLVLAGNAKNPVLGAGGGGADVKGGRLVLDYNDTGVAPDVKTILTAGYAQTPKFSSGSIRTSNTPDVGKGLGWKNDAAAKQETIAYTWYGDANLDGQVDVTDLGSLATNWQTSNVWAGGDFNYDGFVDVTDLGALATNWQAGVGNPLGRQSLQDAMNVVGLGGVSVPEPASIGAVGLCLAAAVSRRRSRRTR